MSQTEPSLVEASERSARRGELREILRMSFPIVVATCCRMFMDVTDYWMISRTGNTDAQAAILPAQMVTWAYIVIGMGMMSIVNTMASQSLGRGELKQCSAYAWQVLYMAAGFWVIGFALWPVLPSVFRLAGHDAGIQDLECRYTAIAVWTIGPSIAATGLGNFFNGIHRPRVTMAVALEGIVINAAVSFVLIFGKLGFEPMGIEGAAWGTVVGTNYRALRFTVKLLGRPIREKFGSGETWRLDLRKVRTILRFGGPSGLQWCSDVTVWATFTVVLVGSYFGKTDQLATNAAWQYLRVSFMPALGLGIALSSIVGRRIGEGDPEGAVRMTRLGTRMLLGYMVTLSVVFLVFRKPLIGFFCSDPEVIRIGAWVMVCAAVFQVFDALGIAHDSALKGAGDTVVPAIVFVLSHWLIVIGGGFLAAELFPELRSVGPWIAASVLIVFTGLFLMWRWNRRAWMKIDVFQYEGATAEERAGEAVV